MFGALPPFGCVFLFLSLSSEADGWFPGRNSPEFRPNLKQSEAYSAACVLPGPELHCFTLHKVSSLATWALLFWSPPKPTASRSPIPLFSFLLVGSCSLLPAPSLSPYDAPTPLPGEANLEACACAHFCDACGNGRQQGCCVQPCLTAPLVRSLLALEQQFPTTPNNNHRDMTTRWPFPWARHAVPALLLIFAHVRGTLRRDHVVQ